MQDGGGVGASGASGRFSGLAGKLKGGLVSSIGAGRLALMAIVAVALIGALMTVAGGSSSGDYGYLHTDLDPASSAAIAEKLEAAGVPYRVSADGTSVMAPKDQLANLRMTLAGDQLGGRIGYAILDGEQSFGQSAAREKLTATRAIEGELARSIETLRPVRQARVHLVMPERAPFAAEARAASAAVTLQTRGKLEAGQVAAIRDLVAAAVPDLAPGAVSVVDQNGRLLARAGEEGVADASDADARQSAVEAKLRDQIESLIEPIVGAGKVRAEVAAVIDRDATREEAKTFDPDAQVIARQITSEDGTEEVNSAGVGGPVSVSEQLPNAQNAGLTTAGAAGGDQSRTSGKQLSEDITYENSATSRTTLRAPGAVKRLTVAVMIDGGKKGLPAAETARLQRLVESAIGFDAERGDSVVIEAMAFAPPPVVEEAITDQLAALDWGWLTTALKLLVIGAIGIWVLRILRGNGDAAAGSAAAPAITDITGQSAPAYAPAAAALPSPDSESGISAESLRSASATVASHPGEALSVVRGWMAN